MPLYCLAQLITYSVRCFLSSEVTLHTDFDFFAEEEKNKKKEDIEWQKALLLNMQYETDSDKEQQQNEEDENWEEDSYDEFSKDNFTQQYL